MDKKGFLKGAAIGAILASITALFFAPQAGKKTRDDVKKLVDSVTKQMMKEMESLKGISKESYHKLVAKSVKDFSKGKKIAQEYLDEVTEILQDRWTEVKKELSKK